MTTNNDYILCRWRDAITDPPPDGWRGLIKDKNGTTYRAIRTSWPGMPIVWEILLFEGEDHDIEPGDQWLDITTIPAVPREAVQAAVDYMADVEAQEDGGADFAYQDCIDSVEHHTGVTPTEVIP